MGFKGQTYRLAFSEGGLNGNDNYDVLPPTAFIYPSSRNLNLQNGGREPRGGTAHVNNSAITGTPKCLGIGQYLTASANNVLSAHSDGKVWKDQASTIVTGMSQTNPFRFTQGGSKMYICDGVTAPQVWTGSGSAAAISTSASDWSGSNQPGGMYVHARGANRRMVAYNVSGFKNNVYLSANGNFDDFGNTNGLKFTIDTQDTQGVVAVIDFNNDLLLFGKQWAYILMDSDTSTANWGYQKAPWRGGVAHDRLLIKVENNVYAMAPDGDIYNVLTAAQLNDYKRASLTRPAFIHKYIANNVDMTKINDFHVAWDPTTRCIKWWVTRVGQTLPDTALCFYVDRVKNQTQNVLNAGDPGDCWSIHDAQDNPSSSGYAATASATITKSDGSQVIYTGDSVGFIWELEKSSKSDNGNAYVFSTRSAFLSLDMPRNSKLFVRARLIYIARGNYNLTFNWWIDDVSQSSQTVSITNTGTVFGSGIYDTSTFSNRTINQVDIPLGAYGSRIQVEVQSNTAGADFLLSQLLIDFMNEGVEYI